MKKIILSVIGILLLLTTLVGCRAKQSNTQVNNIVPSQQFSATKKVESNDVQSKKSTINPYHPIVFVERTGDGNLSKPTVLGGYQNNKWYAVDDFDYFIKGKKMELQSFSENQMAEGRTVDTNLAKGNETFKFYSNTKLISTVDAKGSKPTLFVSQASGQSALSFDVDNINTKEDFIIGVNGEWNALPREPKVLSDNSLLVDLDSDGIVEKITSSANEVSKDYYKVVVEMEKGNKKIKASEWNMGKESLNNFKVMALDLNGDGKMEIIAHSTGTAGGISIGEISGDKSNNVLGFDSGE